jgi:putative ABC transport system permease protein
LLLVGIYLKILWQSLVLSFAEIRAAKLRSFLSLMGISIGIICIISVRTAVNSLEINVQNTFASLGNNIIYVQKWAWILGDDRDYPWWKFVNRPITNRRELEQLQQKLKGAEASCILYFAGGAGVIADDRVAEGTQILGASYDYNKIKEMEFTEGRYFTPAEAANAQPVAIIGATVAETLFEGKGSPEGKEIKINGVKVTVIGVLKKEGSDIFGLTLDNNVIVPFSFMSMFVNMNSLDNDPLLAVVPKKGVPLEEFKYELRGAMRSIRRLSPFQDDNFALNQVSVFADGIASLLSIVNFAGLIIGSFSIFVGAFGIANIMFVSVQERVYQIGIKKAMGARKIYILIEFLLESIMLCVLGGLIGLAVVILLFKGLGWVIAHNGSDFKFYITAKNIFIGISISVVTGIVAGFLPAWSAANMKPVDAIRGEVSDLFKSFMDIFRGKKADHLG